MTDSYHWLDVERIAEELFDRFPDEDPISMPFPRLVTLVQGLEGFKESPGHPCNERILEAIQQAWISEQDD